MQDDAKMVLGMALGRVPSGVFILTVGEGEEAGAMLVSWVQQAGFEPAMVTVGLARGREIGGKVKKVGRFGLSVVEEGDVELMKKYARGLQEGEGAFEGVRTERTERGVVVLVDALAWLECELAGVFETGGDHDLVLGRVIGGKLIKKGKPVVHVRGNGMRY